MFSYEYLSIFLIIFHYYTINAVNSHTSFDDIYQLILLGIHNIKQTQASTCRELRH